MKTFCGSCSFPPLARSLCAASLVFLSFFFNLFLAAVTQLPLLPSVYLFHLCEAGFSEPVPLESSRGGTQNECTGSALGVRRSAASHINGAAVPNTPAESRATPPSPISPCKLSHIIFTLFKFEKNDVFPLLRCDFIMSLYLSH